MDQASSPGGLVPLYMLYSLIPLCIVGAFLWLQGAMKDSRNTHNRKLLEKTFQQFEEAYEKVIHSAPLQFRDSLNVEATKIEKTHPETAALLRSLGSAIANTNITVPLAQWRAALRDLHDQIPAVSAFWPNLGGAMFALTTGCIIGLLVSNPTLLQVFWGPLTQFAHWLFHLPQ